MSIASRAVNAFGIILTVVTIRIKPIIVCHEKHTGALPFIAVSSHRAHDECWGASKL